MLTCSTKQKGAPQEAARLLAGGKTILYPTETIYGLGADATRQSAVGKISMIKQAGTGDRGYIALVKDIGMAQEYASFSQNALDLAKKHWPGPLTIIVPIKRPSLLEHCAKQGSLALRVSPHPFVRAVFGHFDRPIVSTSANITGHDPFSWAKEAMEFFKTQNLRPDAIFDEGKMENALPSAIVDCTGEEPIVIREGLAKI